MNSSHLAFNIWSLSGTFLVIIGFVVWTVHEWRIELSLQQHGVNTQATIVKLEKSSIGRTLVYRVEYKFYIDNAESWGGNYTNEQMISPAHARRLAQGDTVMINYLPMKPGVSKLTGTDTDHTSRDTVLSFAILTSIIWVSFVVDFFSKK